MIYKVVFKKEEAKGIHVTETKFKGISRVCMDKGNGVTFFDSEGKILTFIPNESLLYIEKVKPRVTDHVSPATATALFGIDPNRSLLDELAKGWKREVEKQLFASSGIPKEIERG